MNEVGLQASELFSGWLQWNGKPCYSVLTTETLKGFTSDVTPMHLVYEISMEALQKVELSSEKKSTYFTLTLNNGQTFVLSAPTPERSRRWTAKLNSTLRGAFEENIPNSMFRDAKSFQNDFPDQDPESYTDLVHPSERGLPPDPPYYSRIGSHPPVQGYNNEQTKKRSTEPLMGLTPRLMVIKGSGQSSLPTTSSPPPLYTEHNELRNEQDRTHFTAEVHERSNLSFSSRDAHTMSTTRNDPMFNPPSYGLPFSESKPTQISAEENLWPVNATSWPTSEGNMLAYRSSVSNAVIPRKEAGYAGEVVFSGRGPSMAFENRDTQPITIAPRNEDYTQPKSSISFYDPTVTENFALSRETRGTQNLEYGPGCEIVLNALTKGRYFIKYSLSTISFCHRFVCLDRKTKMMHVVLPKNVPLDPHNPLMNSEEIIPISEIRNVLLLQKLSSQAQIHEITHKAKVDCCFAILTEKELILQAGSPKEARYWVMVWLLYFSHCKDYTKPRSTEYEQVNFFQNE